jgi:ribosomal protein L11
VKKPVSKFAFQMQTCSATAWLWKMAGIGGGDHAALKATAATLVVGRCTLNSFDPYPIT